ncbi:Archease [Olavius sp. associated proteobacterium Delta 1]|nr:Archease [Olavius sp. associated proteobacterium Delta 1]
MSNDKSAYRAGPYRGRAFEEIEHTADRALKIYGTDLQDLLLNAAGGMNSLLGPATDTSIGQGKKSIALDAIDAESLLVEWLSELAYWAETESLIFHKFDLHSVSPTHVKATIHGRRVAQLERHIKAVTYHNLKITQTDEGLTATVVFDV